MSIITSLPATPNRIRIVIAFLRRLGDRGIGGEELQTLLAPPALQNDRSTEDATDPGTTIPGAVLREMRNLQLLDESGDTVSLATGSPGADEAKLLQDLEERLLDPSCAELYRQSAFPRALAWFLCQPPEQPMKWDLNYRDRVAADCGEGTSSFELTNTARWQQFVYWARFLGFVLLMQAENNGVNVVIPDPTAALARHLPATMAVQGPCHLSSVLSELAVRLPVMEGGIVRNEVEALLPPEKRRPEGSLSRSTSLGLERLELQGSVKLDSVADAHVVNLDGAGEPRGVSHITWLE